MTALLQARCSGNRPTLLLPLNPRISGCNRAVIPCGLADQDALRVYEVHQPLPLTSLPGNS